MFDGSRPGPTNNAAIAAHDVLAGLYHWPMWTALTWFNIKNRYRRTKLGPFWLTINAAIFIAGIGIVFSYVFTASTHKYIPHLAAGFIGWSLVASSVKESCAVFIGAKKIILHRDIPYSIYIYMKIYEILIVFLHNLVIIFPVYLIFSINPGLHLLMIIPGIFAVLLNALWVGMVVGTVCARFRDLGQVIPSLLQLMFFLTPIMWLPERLGRYEGYLDVNLFYHFLEVLRGPMLGYWASPTAWTYILITTIVGWAVTLNFFGKYRRRIIFWL